MSTRASIIVLFVLLTATCFAQFGISTEFRSYQNSELGEVVNEPIFRQNYGISLDYWARLKNYRWEMMPTLSYSFSPRQKTEFNDMTSFQLTSGRFQFKNNFYILDFKNDCNCPTFSKQSGWLAKSFYLQVSPGYSFNQIAIQSEEESNPVKVNANLLELGIGAGFDFGISDLITISPYFNYVITSTFGGSAAIQNFELENGSRLNHIVAGIRVGLRPDYARPKTMRRRNLRY